MTTSFDFTTLPARDRGSVLLFNRLLQTFPIETIPTIVERLSEWAGDRCELDIDTVEVSNAIPETGLNLCVTRAGVRGHAILHLDRTMVSLFLAPETEEPLGDFERGFVTTAVADLFDVARRVGFPPVDVRPAQPSDLRVNHVGERLFSVVARASRGKMAMGLLTCVASERWWSAFVDVLTPRPMSFARWPAVSVRADVLLGSVPIPRAELRTLEQGDVLFPDHGVHLEDIVGGDLASISFRGSRANARLSVDGDRWLCEIRTPWIASQPMTDDIDLSQTEPLANAEVPVEIRLGETHLRLQDLSSIAPGYVIELSQPVGAGVDIVVNGQNIARGELVNVEGQLGVRVTTLNR